VLPVKKQGEGRELAQVFGHQANDGLIGIKRTLEDERYRGAQHHQTRGNRQGRRTLNARVHGPYGNT
jgi:hypothetical protein